MKNVTVRWMMSEDERKRKIIETGQPVPERHEFTLSLEELTPEQRKPFVELFFDRYAPDLDMSHPKTFDTEKGRSYNGWIVKDFVRYEREPTIEEVVKLARSNAEQIALSEAYQARLKREEAETKARNDALHAEASQIIEQLAEAGDREDLDKFFRDYPQYKDVSQHEHNGHTIHRLITDAMREIRTRRREEEKERWISEHGSEYLQQAFERGYHCGRIYAIERAAQEFPAWHLDYYDDAHWRERTNPSPQAIKEETELLDKGMNVEIVWLLEEPRSEPDDDDELWSSELPFEVREALKISDFLGKYNLFKW